MREHGTPVKIVTPFSWARPLTYPVFAPRLVLQRVHGTASVLWYRHWHEVFLRNALERELAAAGDCVIYAQGPLDARAALAARTGPRQRVVMAVHFRTSQADEHAEPGRELKRDGRVFRAIRETEREVIQQLDGLVYVTKWARDALLTWLPEAVWVPSTVISNFVAPLRRRGRRGRRGRRRTPRPASTSRTSSPPAASTTGRTTGSCWKPSRRPARPVTA